jgi:hypothetical protein
MRMVGQVAMFMICALIVVAAILAVPVMIGFVVEHVHHMVKG